MEGIHRRHLPRCMAPSPSEATSTSVKSEAVPISMQSNIIRSNVPSHDKPALRYLRTTPPPSWRFEYPRKIIINQRDHLSSHKNPSPSFLPDLNIPHRTAPHARTHHAMNPGPCRTGALSSVLLRFAAAAAAAAPTTATATRRFPEAIAARGIANASAVASAIPSASTSTSTSTSLATRRRRHRRELQPWPRLQVRWLGGAATGSCLFFSS